MSCTTIYDYTLFAKWIQSRQTVFDNIIAAKMAGNTEVLIEGLLSEGRTHLFHISAYGKYETGVKRIGLHTFLGGQFEREANRLYFGFSLEDEIRIFRNLLLKSERRYNMYVCYSIDLGKISPGIRFFRG